MGTLTMDHMANMQSLQLFDRPNKKVIDLTQNTVAFDMRYELEAFKQMVENQAYEKHDLWLNRSRKVAKWSEKARKSVGILFPGGIRKNYYTDNQEDAIVMWVNLY